MSEIRPIYREWLEHFGTEVTLQAYPSRDRRAVIIDNRSDDLTREVMANFVAFLPDWNFQPIGAPSKFGPDELNALMLTPEFWNQFHEEHILIFQRDTVCFQPLDASFLEYDFIGAPCGNPGLTMFDMNGGLSLRRRSAMLKALAQETPQDGMPEDMYFTRALRKMGMNLPTLAVACSFSVESLSVGLSFGVHGTDKLYHPDSLAAGLVAAAKAPCNSAARSSELLITRELFSLLVDP